MKLVGEKKGEMTRATRETTRLFSIVSSVVFTLRRYLREGSRSRFHLNNSFNELL